MCTACGCKDTFVTIDAPVRTSTSGKGTVMNGSTVGGSELHKSDASVINGWNVPAPYGKGK
jgi:hypothetical protein